jgi:uncharacterized protein YkwD
MRQPLLALALVLLASVSPATAATPSLSQQITARVQVVRGDGIRASSELYYAARTRARQLAAADALDGHAGFRRMVARVDGSRWRIWGEVMGWHIRPGATARWFVDAWLASSVHRRVVLGRWDRLATSCARSLERVYCVTIFGLRR